MGIHWSKDLEFDVRAIDDQQKAFLSKANHFLDGCKEGKNVEEMKTMIRQLEKQTVIYFSAEEKLFKKYRYPDRLFHQVQHRNFKKDFNDLKKVFKKEGSTLRFSMLASYIVSELLFEHVNQVDKKFSKFLKKK